MGPHDTRAKTQADAWLVEIAQAAVSDVLAHLPWSAKLDPVRFDVLAEMAFNIG